MTVTDMPCPWSVDWSDVLLYCPTAPTVGEGGISEEQADAALLAAQAVVWEATGRRFGVCSRIAAPCGHNRCGGACGSLCCTSTRYDMLDLDPLGRAPVVSIDAVTVDGAPLDASDFLLVEERYLVRVPSGTRWPTRTDLFDLSCIVEWTFGLEPSTDLLVNGVVPLACELAKKLAGQACSIPDRVVSVTREGTSFVMTDLTAMVTDGLIGPAATIAAIKRAHPWGPAVGKPGGVFDPAQFAYGPQLLDVQPGASVGVVYPLYDRVQGDDWVWDWTTTSDISDWSDLEVFLRSGPTRADTLLASTDDASILTTLTDFATGRVWWKVPASVSTALDSGWAWLEASATVPAMGGEWTFHPAQRVRIRPEVAT